MLLFPTVIDKIVRNSCFGKNYGQFLYFGFDNGYLLNRFYGHTGLYGNHHPVKPPMVFFTFHSSLFTLSEAKSLSQEHIHYLVGISHGDCIVTIYIGCSHVEVRDA